MRRRFFARFVLDTKIYHLITNDSQMDMRLIPMLALLYLLSFLDRKLTTALT